MSKRTRGAELVLLTAWLALLVLAMARGTLSLPYLSDDFEHGQLIAQIRAGLAPGRNLFTLSFHGQTLVLLRLLFWVGTMAGGMSLTWVRLGICAAHIAGAVACAVLCTRWTGSRFAGFLAGTLYAGALGFINEQIWWPSSAIFCLGAAFLLLAFVALDQDTKNPSAAVLLLIVAALGLNGVLVAALALPLYCWLFGRRRTAAILIIAIGSRSNFRCAGLNSGLGLSSLRRFGSLADLPILPCPDFEPSANCRLSHGCRSSRRYGS
jgi:hypothetical protein